MANDGRVGKWSPERMAEGLGWFSIGLGVAEVLAPRQLGRMIGLRRKHTFLLRLLGLREIASGLGILSKQRPAGWLWSRVGGDALDLALLGVSLGANDRRRGRLTAATAAVAGVTALDLFCSQELSRTSKAAGDGAVHVEKKRHDQPLGRRALSLLAELSEPAAVYEPSRLGGSDRADPLALDC